MLGGGGGEDMKEYMKEKIREEGEEETFAVCQE